MIEDLATGVHHAPHAFPAATSLVVAPAMASPVNPAVSLALGKSVRAGSSLHHKNDLLGGGIVIAVLAAAAAAAGVVVAAGNDDTPSSP